MNQADYPAPTSPLCGPTSNHLRERLYASDLKFEDSKSPHKVVHMDIQGSLDY